MNRILLSLMFVLSTAAWAGPLDETRYCGSPVRNTDGTIKRSSTVLTAFKKIHPCPATGLTTGACPGWSMNHVIPLACGGCDSVSNLAWLPVQIKSCSSWWCVDRYERKVYASLQPIPDTGNCANTVVPVK